MNMHEPPKLMFFTGCSPPLLNKMPNLITNTGRHPKVQPQIFLELKY